MYTVKRGDRWTGYARIGGKRLSVGTYDSKSEAEYQALKAERSGLRSPSRGDLTLAKWVDQWLSGSDLQKITLKGYRRILDTYALPEIGDLEVSQISPVQISKLLDDLRARGVGSATIAQVKASLGSAFSKLVQTGEIPSNPTHGITVRSRHADIAKIVDPDDFRDIEKNLPTLGAKLFARFLVASGCRFGEATEIRVKDLNFKTGELFVQRRVSDLGSSHPSRFVVVDATKSGHKRSLMLSKALLQEISDYVKTKALRKEDLLFPRSLVVGQPKLEPSLGAVTLDRPFELGGKKFQHGTLYAYTHGGCRCGGCKEAVRKYRQKQSHTRSHTRSKGRFIDQSSHLPRDVWRTIWNKAIAKSGIGWYPRTHDLRHANATQLLKSGVDLHEVKERLGHRSVKTTERYLHRLRHNQSKASEGVNDYLE